MKKIILSAALALIPMTHAMADENIGCGFGSMIWEGQSGTAPKVLGATTNGTSGNQTFGITFGTLGCSSEGAITSKETLALFIDGNLDNLARDMAKGEGEALNTLAQAWGVAEQDQAAFATLAKNNFATVFNSENTTSNEVYAALNTLLKQNKQLSAYHLS